MKSQVTRHFLSLNTIFITGVILVLAVAFGFLPREVAFVVVALYAGYILWAPVSSGTELFVRSIPFFIALPITDSFDNFNMWRILLVLLFLKWLVTNKRWLVLLAPLRSITGIKTWLQTNRLEAFGLLYFALATLSIVVAPDTTLAIKRLMYITNAVFLFIILRSLIGEDVRRAVPFMRGFALSAILVVLLGYVQFFAAYFAPAWIFHYWWGQVVSVNMFGQHWGDIVTNFGNTWFSYSGATLRLRMFSIFPDSHSFPMYVIMALPAFLAAIILGKKILWPLIEHPLNRRYIRQVLRARYVWMVMIGLTLMMLALILSGTRGIWLSVLGTFAVFGLLWFVREGKRVLVPLAVVVVLFALMFPVYFGILSFPHFQDTQFTTSASFERFRSIFDFGETSNQGRIYIWGKTLSYIKQNPVWGIGIGNYPLILVEPLSASRAGASAHNLYLHIASTVGLVGLVVFLAFLVELVRRSIRYIRTSTQPLFRFYVGAMLFSLAWIGAYSMTDAALFDGRVLLGFMAMVGIGVGIMRR